MSKFLHKEKAITNFLSTFKRERKKRLSELDIEFMKALETNNTTQQSEIANQKNILRDFPETITENSFSTLDELRSLWPSEVLDLPNSW